MVAKISTTGNRKWEIFWADPNFWGSLAPPPMGVGGQGSCRSIDLVEGYDHENFRKNRNSGFREKSTCHFSPWAPEGSISRETDIVIVLLLKSSTLQDRNTTIENVQRKFIAVKKMSKPA